MPSHSPEYDLDTLARAAEIKRDPKRHAAVKSHARKRVRDMQAVVGKA